MFHVYNSALENKFWINKVFRIKKTAFINLPLLRFSIYEVAGCQPHDIGGGFPILFKNIRILCTISISTLQGHRKLFLSISNIHKSSKISAMLLFQVISNWLDLEEETKSVVMGTCLEASPFRRQITGWYVCSLPGSRLWTKPMWKPKMQLAFMLNRKLIFF